MPSPRHTSKLEQTCQRDAFVSAAGRRAGRANACAGRAQEARRTASAPRRSRRSSRRAVTPAARRRASAGRASPGRLGASRRGAASRAGRPLCCSLLRRSIQAVAEPPERVASIGARASRARLVMSSARVVRAVVVAATASPPQARGPQREVTRPPWRARRQARTDAQGSSIRAQILTSARIVLRGAPFRALQRWSSRAHRQELLYGGATRVGICSKAGLPVRRVLPRASSDRTIIA